MFRNLRENRDRPQGKQATEQTLKNTAAQYSIGRPEWQQDWTSHTKKDFNQAPKYEEVKNFKMKGSQVCFGTDKVDYQSNTKASFGSPPENYEVAKPLIDKSKLAATNYSLGDDRIHYKTSAQQQFMHPQKQPQNHQPKFKNYNQKIDVISGKEYDQNKRSYVFEGYSEAPANRVSQNKTELPQDLFVMDPITGRKIAQKGGR